MDRKFEQFHGMEINSGTIRELQVAARAFGRAIRSHERCDHPVPSHGRCHTVVSHLELKALQEVRENFIAAVDRPKGSVDPKLIKQYLAEIEDKPFELGLFSPKSDEGPGGAI